jgi:hypothetical protein
LIVFRATKSPSSNVVIVRVSDTSPSTGFVLGRGSPTTIVIEALYFGSFTSSSA